MRVLRASDRVAEPWRNGRGRTWQVDVAQSVEVAGEGPDFDWRISIAEIDEAGPFSRFPSVHRTIAVIDGAGFEIIVDGVVRKLIAQQPYSFSGDADVSSRPLDGPTLDLNLMTSAAYAGMISFVSPGQEDPVLLQCGPGETIYVLAVTLGLECDVPGSAISLGLHDAARVDDGAMILTGRAGSVAAVVRVHAAGG